MLDKVRTDGVAPTLAAVRNKLDQPLALGRVWRIAPEGAAVVPAKKLSAMTPAELCDDSVVTP